jgi:hypothetical protein
MTANASPLDSMYSLTSCWWCAAFWDNRKERSGMRRETVPTGVFREAVISCSRSETAGASVYPLLQKQQDCIIKNDPSHIRSCMRYLERRLFLPLDLVQRRLETIVFSLSRKVKRSHMSLLSHIIGTVCASILSNTNNTHPQNLHTPADKRRRRSILYSVCHSRPSITTRTATRTTSAANKTIFSS